MLILTQFDSIFAQFLLCFDSVLAFWFIFDLISAQFFLNIKCRGKNVATSKKSAEEKLFWPIKVCTVCNHPTFTCSTDIKATKGNGQKGLRQSKGSNFRFCNRVPLEWFFESLRGCDWSLRSVAKVATNREIWQRETLVFLHYQKKKFASSLGTFLSLENGLSSYVHQTTTLQSIKVPHAATSAKFLARTFINQK